MALRARKVFGTFEKRAPGLVWSGHVCQRQYVNEPGRRSSIRTLLPSIFCQHENETSKRKTRGHHIACGMFLSTLQGSVCNSSYFNPNLRPKQVQ